MQRRQRQRRAAAAEQQALPYQEAHAYMDKCFHANLIREEVWYLLSLMSTMVVIDKLCFRVAGTLNCFMHVTTDDGLTVTP